MIKAIIFDLGGAILINKVEAVYKRFSENMKLDFNSLIELKKNIIKIC
ncbi:hypothetical protein KO317_02185 [Candidatus Micrarchaeota archaeon]|jgi:hypothetical protein|nr:hypothetical protein [Candidatus Micrarchaeota archaeon]